MILVQLFLIGLSMIKSYTVDIVIIENGENYLSCVMKNSFGKFMVNMISQAGLMRTLDGKVTQVVYRYTRGVNMPV